MQLKGREQLNKHQSFSSFFYNKNRIYENYSAAACMLDKKSWASTTKTTPAALGRTSSSLGFSLAWPGTSTICTGFTLPFCRKGKQEGLMKILWLGNACFYKKQSYSFYLYLNKLERESTLEVSYPFLLRMQHKSIIIFFHWSHSSLMWWSVPKLTGRHT